MKNLVKIYEKLRFEGEPKRVNTTSSLRQG